MKRRDFIALIGGAAAAWPLAARAGGSPMFGMKRREFMTLLGGTALAWPLAARAQ